MKPICLVERPKPPTNLKGREVGSSLASGVLKNTGSNWSKVMVWLFYNQLPDLRVGRVQNLLSKNSIADYVQHDLARKSFTNGRLLSGRNECFIEVVEAQRFLRFWRRG
jgi:hypothetical protein